MYSEEETFIEEEVSKEDILIEIPVITLDNVSTFIPNSLSKHTLLLSNINLLSKVDILKQSPEPLNLAIKLSNLQKIITFNNILNSISLPPNLKSKKLSKIQNNKNHFTKNAKVFNKNFGLKLPKFYNKKYKNEDFDYFLYVEFPKELIEYVNEFKYKEMVEVAEASNYLGFVVMTECLCKCIADYLRELSDDELRDVLG